VTLRYPYEVRKEDEYFDEIEDEKIPKDMMELASHIVETKSGGGFCVFLRRRYGHAQRVGSSSERSHARGEPDACNGPWVGTR
jgi:hypothetical protein